MVCSHGFLITKAEMKFVKVVPNFLKGMGYQEQPQRVTETESSRSEKEKDWDRDLVGRLSTL